MRASNIAKVLGRSWKKTVLFIVLLTLVGMFLCLSGSVWASAQRSITKAEEDFTTIVVPSLPAMRELAGLKDNFDSLNPSFSFNDLAGSYRSWQEQQASWERYAALDGQIRQTGLSLSQAQPDSRRMAMAYVEGASSVRPDDVLGAVTGFYFPPHNRVAYVVECTGTAMFEWMGAFYADALLNGAALGGVSLASHTKQYAHLPSSWAFLRDDQPGVEQPSGQFASAALKVEEIISLQPQVVREPQWLSAAVPIVRPAAEGEGPPQTVFEPGKRYIVIGHYVGETSAGGTFGFVRESGALSDDQMLQFSDHANPVSDPVVNRQGGIALLPKDWLPTKANTSTAYAGFFLQDMDFQYDEVRVELNGTLEDFLSDPANRYWKETLEDIRVTNESVQVIATGNTESLYPFHQNRLTVSQGRDITPQEYANGANVCLISREYAQLNRIRVGDTLPMQFYPGRFSARPYTKATSSNPTFIAQPMPYDASLGLTDTQEFTVVGIYSGDIPWDLSDYSISANAVILPDKAMPYLADVPPPDGESGIASPLLYGLIIPNGQAQAVYDELNDMEYGRLFAIMDQGYSVVMPGLTTIRDNAVWLMLICLIAWVAILALFLVLFIFRQRQDVAIMRSLGAGRGAAVGYLIAGVVVVTLASALLAAGGAYALYDAAFDVALRAPSTESERIGDYSEMPVTRNTDEEKQDLLRDAFVPENKGLMILGIIGGQWLLLVMASLICSRQLSGRNPMLMIQSKEE